MLTNDTIITVTNRDHGGVGYTIPDLNNLHRKFTAGEKKEVKAEEMRKLAYLPGGMALIENCLVINNDELVAELLGDVEPEYRYTISDVQDLLENGTLDELEDCLNFAPEGVIDLAKSVAVDIELNDIRKREMIQGKTGTNITNVINLKREMTKEEAPETDKPVRKASKRNSAAAAPTAPARKANSNKYKIVG